MGYEKFLRGLCLKIFSCSEFPNNLNPINENTTYKKYLLVAL